MELTWEDPPPDGRTGGRKDTAAAVIKALRANPNKWAFIKECKDYSCATHYRNVGHDCEFVVRKVDGVIKLYGICRREALA